MADPTRKLLLDRALANRHTNETWLAAMAHVPFDALDADRGAFFGSIFGTWNHILLGDRVWLGRLTDEPFPIESLAQRLCADIPSLRSERSRTDEALIELVEREPNLERIVSYANTAGVLFGQPMEEILQHLFSHQDHHRGQISQMCHELGIAIPDGGLLAYFRQTR